MTLVILFWEFVKFVSIRRKTPARGGGWGAKKTTRGWFLCLMRMIMRLAAARQLNHI